jgi:hypothetical protein
VHANKDKNRVVGCPNTFPAQLNREMDRYKLDILGVSEGKMERKWADNDN